MPTNGFRALNALGNGLTHSCVVVVVSPVGRVARDAKAYALEAAAQVLPKLTVAHFAPTTRPTFVPYVPGIFVPSSDLFACVV